MSRWNPFERVPLVIAWNAWDLLVARRVRRWRRVWVRGGERLQAEQDGRLEKRAFADFFNDAIRSGAWVEGGES